MIDVLLLWRTRRFLTRLLFSILLLAGCALSSSGGVAGGVETPESQVITPVILSIRNAPVPFTGSDSRTHLVYELWMLNFSSHDATVERVEMVADGNVLETLDANDVAGRLQPAGRRQPTGVIAAGSQSLLFVHVILANGATPPKNLSHQVVVNARGREFSETGGATTVNTRPVAVIGPPLRGGNYVSADSCCDATRHTRAALPVNGRVWLAQRYAVDWEQLDATNRIYVGPRDDVSSYKIYGAPVLAVANGTVVTATDGLPDQTPGKFPENLPIEQADGNAVIEDLGGGNYALYAHMKPDSVAVHEGQTVTRGQVIGLVGNSGNTIAPHLHFQLMNGPLSLASNGLPYETDAYGSAHHFIFPVAVRA
jgi:hypothetical protein